MDKQIATQLEHKKRVIWRRGCIQEVSGRLLLKPLSDNRDRDTLNIAASIRIREITLGALPVAIRVVVIVNARPRRRTLKTAMVNAPFLCSKVTVA